MRPLFILQFFFYLGCGGIDVGLGGGNTPFPNDPRPSGTIVTQGLFAGQNSQTASGSALIFSSGTTYTLRLEGVSFPVETGLIIKVYTSTGTQLSQLALRASTGNHNYVLPDATASQTFASVYIVSSPNLVNYAYAPLY